MDDDKPLDVLVIDADPQTAALFRDMPLKLRVALAPSDAEGAIKERAPDVIFCALSPEGDDRLAVLRRLVSDPRLQKTSIIGLASQGDMDLPLDAVAAEYFFKPLDRGDFDEVLEGVRQRRRQDMEHADDPLYQANAAMKRQDYALVQELAKPLLSSPDTKKRTDAEEVTALALFHQKRYEDCLKMFVALAECGGSGKNWMNVGIARALMGDSAGADVAMEKAMTIQEQVLQSMPELQGQPLVNVLTPSWMVYYFVRALCDGGQAVRALPWLDKLRASYERWETTDDTVMATGGMPYFPQMIDAIEAVARGAGPAFKAAGWIAAFAANADADGRAALERLSKDLAGISP